jgi:hypothetical protein
MREMSDEALKKLKHDMWRDAWKSLSYRERECVKHWFQVGKTDGHYLTRKQLAEVFGISVRHLRRVVLLAARKFDISRVLALVATKGCDQ